MNTVEKLTDREKEVLAILCRGAQNKDIAEKLVISEATVETHLRHIFQKYAVSNRTEAVIRHLSNNQM